mmetsp:Transcript_66089/g.177068  ORF Transcript_66089/g.177068 Transcript_66089/m.177068 type:complete len:135 (+) Transcript_66089:2-406(+)
MNRNFDCGITLKQVGNNIIVDRIARKDIPDLCQGDVLLGIEGKKLPNRAVEAQKLINELQSFTIDVSRGSGRIQEIITVSVLNPKSIPEIVKSSDQATPVSSATSKPPEVPVAGPPSGPMAASIVVPPEGRRRN